ncbi:hypothetical protein DD238_006735 [Peronospora effusa]|uniref:Translin n=1 Tax=Peronospora effusa TaxID=542832 RepID=A0A3M6VPD8_9STRA|nr:hypothetical protein DD238_006735 [Peronospora effusa]
MESTEAISTPTTAAMDLLNRQDFIDMNEEMHEYDEMREKIIKRSREILKARIFFRGFTSCNAIFCIHSKQAIFALHRGDRVEALKLLSDAEKVIPELVALTEKNSSLRDGSLASSLEEYAEAKCFYYYLDTKCLLPRQDVPIVDKNEYLGGVIDFTGGLKVSGLTGELMKYAVVKATARNVEEVKRCKAMVEAISGELIQFDFRNGPLRRKFDSVKYNLRKLENTLYELSLVTNSGLTLQAHSVHEPLAVMTHKGEE